MGRAACGAHRIGRARVIGLSVGLSVCMINDPPDEAATHYAYKASLVGAAHRFELKGEGLGWRIGGKSGLWPYAAISGIRLSYRPVSMQSRRFRADIDGADLGRIVLLST